MPMRQVYFDHQASTPVLPEVLEAMRPWFSENFGSASSLHRYGVNAREALEHAREQMAALINAESPEDIIFTSSATESANLAVKGAAYANQRRGKHIVASAIEHPAVLNSIEFLKTQGFTSTLVKVDRQGVVDPKDVAGAITEETVLVAVHHVNHDIGTIEPIREIAEVVADRGIPLFVDAAASGGWLPIDVQALGAGLLSLAPHRFYGPKGAGVLYRNRRARVAPILHGGVQEGGRRAGTENIPAIVGAGMAAEVAKRELSQRATHTVRLQRRLWDGLKSSIERITLNGPEPGPGRISTNLNISSEFTEGEGQALMCDVNGIAVASGTSCVSKALKISHVLSAIGLEHSRASANIILSLGKDNTEEDVAYFLATFPKIIGKLRGMSPMWEEFAKGRP
ncbi:MAG TPA: cysteine desulfurase family protein [Verrucomicrobiae bacterium]|nr:cysteine desulfurase family protein [Verrucomicrobiae bacterium]